MNLFLKYKGHIKLFLIKIHAHKVIFFFLSFISHKIFLKINKIGLKV